MENRHKWPENPRFSKKTLSVLLDSEEVTEISTCTATVQSEDAVVCLILGK